MISPESLVDVNETSMCVEGTRLDFACLAEVSIVTTNGGPFFDDIFVKLTDLKQQTIQLPRKEAEVLFLIDRLYKLPGFRFESFFEAMTSTENASFICWKRDEIDANAIAEAVADRNVLPQPPMDFEIPQPALFFIMIRRQYSEEHRYYHNWRHICSCLDEFSAVKEAFQHPLEAWLALLFHDIVYNAGAKDNEERSGDIASQVLGEMSVDVELIRKLINLTALHGRHTQLQQLTEEEKMFLDIDAAILGAKPFQYRAYADSVRREYAGIADGLRYNIGRARFLKSMLRSEKIFLSKNFIDRKEELAKTNLQQELQSLGWIARLIA